MQDNAATKRLGIAVSGSVAAHVLIGAAFLLYVSTTLKPSVTERLLVMTLQASFPADTKVSEHSDVAPTDTRDVEGPAQSAQRNAAAAPEATAPEAPEETPDTPLQAAAIEVPAAAVDAPAPVSDAAPQPATQPETPEPAANTSLDEPMAAQLVVTRQSEFSSPADNPNVDPVPVREVAISAAQQKMLKKQFTRWTENFESFDEQETSVTWKKQGQEYVARFRRLPAKDDMGIERVEVDITTEQQGVKLSTQMTMKNLAFSHYGQFVHRWDPNVQIHDDEMDGRFHSNSKINVALDRSVKPVFMGKVTSASHSVNYTETRGIRAKASIFQGGVELGVKRIMLPNRYLPFPDAAPADGGRAHYFDGATRVVFHADGAFEWSSLDGDGATRRAALDDDESTYLIGASGKALHVSGVVNGKVLVYSPHRIVIADDLTYAHPVGVGKPGDDYLGLVSDKYIDIAGPDVTGPGDVTVHAAIYARRRFAVKRFRVRENAMLRVYGSLTAGSLSATEPRFRTRITFDDRLEGLRPPGFPVTDRYEVEAWDGTWREQ